MTLSLIFDLGSVISPPGASSSSLLNGANNNNNNCHQVYQLQVNIICLAAVNGEGNGTPLQYSCLENPVDGGPGGL